MSGQCACTRCAAARAWAACRYADAAPMVVRLVNAKMPGFIGRQMAQDTLVAIGETFPDGLPSADDDEAIRRAGERLCKVRGMRAPMAARWSVRVVLRALATIQASGVAA